VSHTSGFLSTDGSAVLTMFTAFSVPRCYLVLFVRQSTSCFGLGRDGFDLRFCTASQPALLALHSPVPLPAVVTCTVPDLRTLQRGPARRLRRCAERPARRAAGDGSRHLLARVPPRRHPGGHQGPAQGGWSVFFYVQPANVLCMMQCLHAMCTHFLCAGSKTVFSTHLALTLHSTW
jgi:hypothetical protein